MLKGMNIFILFHYNIIRLDYTKFSVKINLHRCTFLRMVVLKFGTVHPLGKNLYCYSILGKHW